MSVSHVSVCVFAFAENLLLCGLETLGQRAFCLYWHTSRPFLFFFVFVFCNFNDIFIVYFFGFEVFAHLYI